MNALSQIELLRKNPDMGTDVTACYLNREDSIEERSFRIVNGSFERTYQGHLYLFAATEAKIREVANRILQLDSTALSKLPFQIFRWWFFEEESILAALQSEYPAIRTQGAQWLKEERRQRIERDHQERNRYIHTYFDILEWWQAQSPLTEEQRAVAQQFFTISSMPFNEEYLQAIEPFRKAHPEEDSSFILCALWFQDHPYHETCQTILEMIKTLPFPSDELDKALEPYGFLGTFIQVMALREEIPLCFFQKTSFKTRQEALDFEKQSYEQQLKEFEEETPMAPLLSQFSETLHKEDEATGTKVSLHYTPSPTESIAVAVHILNGPMQRQYPRLFLPQAKIQDIAGRILQFDPSAIKSLPKSMNYTPFLEKELIFAALQSENPDLRVQGKEWLKQKRREELDSWHCIEEQQIHSYFQELEQWRAKALTEEEWKLHQDCLAFFEQGEKRPCPEEFKHLKVPQTIAYVLWFKDHPYHERCRKILEDIFQYCSKGELHFSFALEEKHGPLAEILTIFWRQIPRCVLDPLAIPQRQKSYPETLQEALALERESYERKLKNLES